jgi:ribA/ribD-fused uncharacterized protein
LQGNQWGELSNSFSSPIQLKGTEWPTVQHFFQAQKFAGTTREEEIRLAPTPEEAKALGRDRRHRVRGGWEAMKESIMADALYAKFTQNISLNALLLSTGEAVLVNNAWKDSYWGTGLPGRKNRLGVLLMRLRSNLRRAEAAEALNSGAGEAKAGEHSENKEGVADHQLDGSTPSGGIWGKGNPARIRARRVKVMQETMGIVR